MLLTDVNLVCLPRLNGVHVTATFLPKRTPQMCKRRHTTLHESVGGGGGVFLPVIFSTVRVHKYWVVTLIDDTRNTKHSTGLLFRSDMHISRTQLRNSAIALFLWMALHFATYATTQTVKICRTSRGKSGGQGHRNTSLGYTSGGRQEGKMLPHHP